MKKVLVVIDMQNDFIDGALGTGEAVAIVPAVVDEIRKDYNLVIATRDTHYEDYLNTNEGRHLPVAHCIKDSDGWQIADGVMSALNEKEELKIIDKPTFGTADLCQILMAYDAENGIGSITLIGLCTDICVVTNALLIKTAFPETPVYVKPDCCAGVTPETHDAALQTMKMCQVDLI